ncbi:hypothetical protein [Pelagicoccus albus]|uniref:Uncharacterized protein n=1 Tax=Pelagicoccus albus TaxID=415222 RepID=A0A7X1E8U1_9BACT|nr:hypothetical protein [Pelagicoccus albus]MBC2607115.1 hypothetical protein [Pelagicoccus albus]
MDKDDKELEEALDLWKEVDVDHPRLSSRVWSRLAADNKDADNLPGFLGLIQAVLGRPIYATVFVVTCVLAGLLAAEFRVAHRELERSDQIIKAYREVVDPLLEEADRGY